MFILILIITFIVAPVVAVLAFLKSLGIGMNSWLWRHGHGHKSECPQPPYLQSFKHQGEAGWIETIIGLTSSRAPFFVYDGFKRLPEGYPWIGRGKFPNKAPSGCGYAVADIHIAKDILTSPHSQKSVMYQQVDFLTCGSTNLFTANGSRWKHARKFIAPAFSTNHVNRMNRICADKLDNMIQTKLDPLADAGKSFNIGKEFVCLTLAIICEAAFEYQMSRQEMDVFTSNLEDAAECFVIMNPLHETFPFLFPRVWRANRSAKTVQAISYKIMENFRRKHGNNMVPDSKREFQQDTIISRIVNNPHYADDQERAADIAILLAAGHDTTAYSISWTLLEIFKTHPPELYQYRQKIQGLPREEWRKVPELDYMIKEGMRLNPVLAMGTVRDVEKEISYMHGDEKIVLPRDSIYFINLFPMFRNPAYYDNPDEFLPSRWVNPKTELAHVPFSIGPRNCIGQSLANAEVHTVLSTLLGRYDFIVEDPGHPEFLTTLKPVNTKLIPKKLF